LARGSDERVTQKSGTLTLRGDGSQVSRIAEIQAGECFSPGGIAETEVEGLVNISFDAFRI